MSMLNFNQVKTWLHEDNRTKINRCQEIHYRSVCMNTEDFFLIREALKAPPPPPPPPSKIYTFGFKVAQNQIDSIAIKLKSDVMCRASCRLYIPSFKSIYQNILKKKTWKLGRTEIAITRPCLNGCIKTVWSVTLTTWLRDFSRSDEVFVPL